MRGDRELLRRTAEIATDFLETLHERPVFPNSTHDDLADALSAPLPEDPSDPVEVLEDVASAVSPGVVATAGPRYFGFVTGGALPATVAVDWLLSTWDQSNGLYATGPSVTIAEDVAAQWTKAVLGLPRGASVAFVTGCQMAHVTCLAAARHAALERAGWDVATDGLWEAPRVSVVAGAHRHVTVDRAIRLLGMGTSSIVVVPADAQGRMRADALHETLDQLVGPVIVCAQAGEVNTGSFDPLREIEGISHAAGAWLHVDAAFGMWAAASPSRRSLIAGHDRADSWAFDAHKWLNVPYDCGIAVCAHPDAHRAAMRLTAAYLRATGEERNPADLTPEASRRARGVTVYAALRFLGRRGVADLVDRCCDRASQFATSIAALPGCEVLNDVVLNQVLFRFADDEATAAVLAAVQESGEAWMGGTVWNDRAAIRVSVSNWRTTEEDIERTVAAFEAALSAVAA
jgi:glutamate/tyrosine decarboxylase-like PLP-dependent enzyme